MLIDGPCGVLEARYDSAPQPAGLQAVLCHPHPQYGGSMHDPVLDCLTRSLLTVGAGVLRFNFRGVGGSAGAYDGGAGEVDDLLAAVSWLQQRQPDDAVWAGGYSFGAWIVWQALDRDLPAQGLLLIAPPVGSMAFAHRQLAIAVDVVIGDADPFADPAALAAWPGVTRHSIAGADHFFTGRQQQLADRLGEIIALRAAERPPATGARDTAPRR